MMPLRDFVSIEVGAQAIAPSPADMQFAVLVVSGSLVGNDAIVRLYGLDRCFLMREQEDAGEKGCRQYCVSG